MLIIRLQRVGKKNEPTFRIVLVESKRSSKSGKVLEILGSYDARDKNETKIDGDRAKYWISKGAQVSDTIHNFLITKKIIEGKKINVLPKKSPIKKESSEEQASQSEKKPVPTEVPKKEDLKTETLDSKEEPKPESIESSVAEKEQAPPESPESK